MWGQSLSDAPTQHLAPGNDLPSHGTRTRAEEALGFTDGQAAWFNVAAADPVTSPRCDRSSRQAEQQRARHWFAVACHLLAHAVAGEEQGMVERAEIQVWRLYLDPFKAAFNL